MKTFNYTKPFPPYFQFEMSISNEAFKKWMKNHWHYSIYISISFIILTSLLQILMQSRPAYKIRPLVIIYKATNASINILCVIRTLPIACQAMRDLPFYFMICDSIIFHNLPQVVFWSVVYNCLRVLDLCDLLVLVFRKKRLPFPLYYHHIIGFIITWYLASWKPYIVVLSGFMNVIGHSVIYFHSLLKTLHINIPHAVDFFIMTFPVMELLPGIYILFSVPEKSSTGEECIEAMESLNYLSAVYLISFLIVVDLFYQVYFVTNRTNKKINRKSN